MGFFKKNKVKCDIGSYMHYIRGVRKSGKTTLFRDLVLEEYGKAECGAHISIGNETGANALDELMTVQAENWTELKEIVSDLVENKSDNEFRLIALDTVDELVKIASDEVLRQHRIKKGKPAESINDAFGGWGAGRKKLIELIDNLLADLQHAGYGVFLIGHTKLRDVKEKNGDEYQQLKSNLSEDYDGIFANKADIIMTISVDKDIEDDHVVGTKRYMHFRDDGFVDCGSRFTDMPEKVPYGAKEYIEAFEAGVRSSIKGGATEAEIKKRKEAEVEQKEKEGASFSKKAKDNKVDADENKKIIDEIMTYGQGVSDDEKDDLKKKIAEAKEKYEFDSFKDLNDFPTKIVKEVKDIILA